MKRADELAAILRRAVYEGVRDALASVAHDQAVTSAARKEGECPDEKTNEHVSSDPRGARTKKRGGSRRWTRKELAEQADAHIDTLAAKRRRATGER